MLERQRFRLLREDPWPTPTDLAQELYAMFVDELPTQLPGVVLDPKGDAVPITIANPPSEGDIPIMRIVRGDESFDLSISGVQLIFTSTITGGGGFSGATGRPRATTGGNVFPGVVVSQVGTTNSYNMDCYPNGRSSPAVPLVVDQLEGDPNFPHNPGRWALVCREADGNYCMNIPVWGP